MQLLLGSTPDELEKSLAYHLEHSTATETLAYDAEKVYRAAAESVKERLVQNWNDTYTYFNQEDPKQCYYLSMEFLQGRALQNAVLNLGLKDEYGEALKKLGYDLETMDATEMDAGLGNGGLGRLASCFMDSIATLNLPAWGYGLRYKYGLFKQAVASNGEQLEGADPWLERGNPWEVKRANTRFPIKFGGEVVSGQWVPDQTVAAVAYDTPIPGYKTKNTISLRLWDAEPIVADFDLAAFNEGDYEKSLAPALLSQQLTSVLYPGDGTREGKALRIKQQYMLCSASLQDIMARFKERCAYAGKKVNWAEFPAKVAVQMNDTHPTLSAPELVRLLIDEEGVSWEEARNIMGKTVAYTNHTVMPEALEKWPLDLLEEILPRHIQIIKRLDEEFIAYVKTKYSGQSQAAITETLNKMTVLENYYNVKPAAPKPVAAGATALATKEEEEPPPPPPLVRMANLCVICGFAVNGVAAIHSEIVKNDVFNDFYKLWPTKFQNKTNGVTPRRWLSFCNPELSAVITKWLGSEEWITDLDKLAGLAKFADDEALHAEWREAKMGRKRQFKAYIKETFGEDINENALYDIQIKRIHEYKRQLLNIMGVVYRYKQIKEMSPAERANVQPRVICIGGKAYATYLQAKRIVRLVNAVGKVINNDPAIGDLMKVYFLPNYNVSLAEKIIPASELSQHISTAGTEASGTSNMKFMMNGCLLIGTLDGANVEIRECVGEENFFLFGATEDQINTLRAERAAGKFKPDPRFVEAMNYIKSGEFGDFDELLSSLEGDEGFGRGDYFLVGYDFPSYLDAQTEVDKMYKDQFAWTKASILSTAYSGKFSSDRTIQQYADEIWDIKALPVPQSA